MKKDERETECRERQTSNYQSIKRQFMIGHKHKHTPCKVTEREGEGERDGGGKENERKEERERANTV